MTDWDKRYREGGAGRDEPHPLITTFAAKLPPGRALDVACGAGRHAIWLAQHGWEVTAVDSSVVAIDLVRQSGVRVNAIVADLERHEFAIEPESFDLIVVCNYLQRDLFPAIRAGRRVGAMVLAVIAFVDDDPGIKPMNPAFLLNPGELLAEFDGWEILHSFEGKAEGDASRRATAELVVSPPGIGGAASRGTR